LSPTVTAAWLKRGDGNGCRDLQLSPSQLQTDAVFPSIVVPPKT
jgi:hypothetical protein